MTIRCGYIIRGTLRGQWWEITRQEVGATYRLDVGGEFYASDDSLLALIEEVEALDGLARW